MKIILAHKYFFRGGGTATYLFALMEELQKRGHECIPFTVAYDQTEVDAYSEYYVSAPLGSDQTHYQDMNLTPLAMLKLFGRATYSFEARAKASRLIEETKPDIAYIHNIYNYMSPSIIDAFAHHNIPIVMRVSDYNLVCPSHKLMRGDQICTECLGRGFGSALRHNCVKGSRPVTIARVATMSIHRWLHVYDRIDLFVTPSAFMREILVRGGYSEDKIHHLPSFYPGQIADGSLNGDEDHILYFGRITEEKGIDTLIEAMSRLEAPPPLMIAGGDVDNTQNRLEALVERLHLDGLVQFVGFQQRDSLDDLIDRAFFTVVPSRWYDNCPMAVPESFAHNKPVIGSRRGGIPEQITADCGLLFEPENPDDLSEKMNLLLKDVAQRKRMGRAAGQRLIAEYSPGVHCDRLLSLFDELIA